MEDVMDFVLRSRLAREILFSLYTHRRMYTRQVLGYAPARKRYDVLVRLAGYGLVRRYEGELCRGRVCLKVVWNELTPDGVRVVKALRSMMGDGYGEDS